MVYYMDTMLAKRISKYLMHILMYVIIAVPFFSCGPREIGYGLMLWSPNESMIQTGSIVPVYGESSITETYTIGAAQSKEHLEIPQWRLDFHRKRNEAL